MRRLALNFLQQWGKQNNRRPLLIRGARQVGKTWLVREYARSYPSFVEINLEALPETIPLFRDLYGKPQQLLSALSLLVGKKIQPGETLLFLDEIQGCKEALLGLRYFKENLPQQAVIAAGSLLEFSFQDLSYPVGRIEFLYIFPMNFEEFLLAQNREDLVQAISEATILNPLPPSIHESLIEEVSLYCLLGG